MGIAMVMRITMIVITTINSTKVKPRRRFLARRARSFTGLPFCVGLSIGCLFLCLAVHVEHALAAPAKRLGVVLVAAHAPFDLARKRIPGDAARKALLLAPRPGGSVYGQDRMGH